MREGERSERVRAVSRILAEWSNQLTNQLINQSTSQPTNQPTKMNLPFLGRGWSFPPNFQRSTNSVAMLEQEADIASCLEILLTTTIGERVMSPDFGCSLNDLLFENLDTTLKTLFASRIETAMLYYEPRIDVETIYLNTGLELEGVVLIEVTYRVRATNTRYNFVFPFYKIEGTDLNLTTSISLLPD